MVDCEEVSMRGSSMAAFLTLVLMAPADTVSGAVAPVADALRAAIMVFAGDPGAAGGDVNADGRAGAADVTGVVLGLRSPTQQGPFGIGFRTMTFTKPSVTVPDEARVLDTHIWYPAAPGTGNIAQRPGGLRNAALAEGAASLPLLMFSHGSCGFQQQSVFFTALIASYGFIVAAPPHPGNSTREILTCSTPHALADSFANRPADISFVVDALLAENADPSSFFHGAIDPARIGMSGHSFGGLTTLRVSALDARVVAGLALAPVIWGTEDEIASIRVPLMVQVGTLDLLLSQGRLAYDLLQPPRFMVEIFGMPHSPFSDFCMECGPDTITLNEAHLYALRFAVPFVMHFVAGDGRFGDFLLPGAAPPGVTYTVDSDRG
jgi:dienelactone hydrolase